MRLKRILHRCASLVGNQECQKSGPELSDYYEGQMSIDVSHFDRGLLVDRIVFPNQTHNNVPILLTKALKNIIFNFFKLLVCSKCPNFRNSSIQMF